MEYSIKVKPGVVFKEINKYIIEAFHALDHACNTFGHNYVITSANDGKHCKTSYHYKNLALDIRLNDLEKSHWYVLRDHLKASLGKYWDVIVENIESETNVHLHMECDLEKLATWYMDHAEGDK